MFEFIKKLFITAIAFIGLNGYNAVNAMNAVPLKCVSNQKCRVKTVKININNYEPLFYPYNITFKKCSGNPFAKLCVPDVVKNINIKVFNPIS